MSHSIQTDTWICFTGPYKSNLFHTVSTCWVMGADSRSACQSVLFSDGIYREGEKERGRDKKVEVAGFARWRVALEMCSDSEPIQRERHLKIYTIKTNDILNTVCFHRKHKQRQIWWLWGVGWGELVQMCQRYEMCVCVCFEMISLCWIKAVMKHAQTISCVMCLQRDDASHTQTHRWYYRTRGRCIKAICISVG